MAPIERPETGSKITDIHLRMNSWPPTKLSRRTLRGKINELLVQDLEFALV